MNSSSLVFDMVMLILIIVTAGYYASKGFLAGILNFVGTLAAIAVGAMAAIKLSPAVFDNFFRKALETKTTEAIAEQSAVNLSQLLHGLVGFLPDSVIEGLVNSFGKSLDFSNAEIARQVVDQVIAPLIIPIISVIVFFVVFAILRVILGVIAAFLSGFNKVPLLGTVNRAMGGISGLLVGVLYVFLVATVVWALDAAYGGKTIESTYFSSSIVFNILGKYNIFR